MRILMVACLMLTALAGCTEEPEPVEQEDAVDFTEYELEATEETGIIRGVVVDTAIVPVADALTQLDPSGLEQTTNEGGAFGFDGLDPGVYTITISKEGYASSQATTQVVAGDAAPPVVKVRLVADPTTSPYVETTVFDGHIACSLRSPVIGVAACGLPGVDEATGNVFLKEYTFDRIAERVQSEMVWDATQATGTAMELSWDDPSSGNQVEIKEGSGSSPVVTQWGREEFEALNLTNKVLWMRTFSTEVEGSDVVDDDIYQSVYRDALYDTLNSTGAPGIVGDTYPQCAFGLCTNNPFEEDCLENAALFDSCFGIGGAGAVIDQPYSVYTNAFYNFLPDDDWLFTKDGAYPQQ